MLLKDSSVVFPRLKKVRGPRIIGLVLKPNFFASSNSSNGLFELSLNF